MFLVFVGDSFWNDIVFEGVLDVGESQYPTVQELMCLYSMNGFNIYIS